MSVSGRNRSRKKNKRRTGLRARRLQSRRLVVLSVALVAAISLGAAGFFFYGNLVPSTPTVVVVVIPSGASANLHLGFEPSKIMVLIGVNNTVVWKNEDSDWHTAHSNIPEFNSGLIQAGDSFTHTFQRAGTYPYHCDPHPWMTGVVTVMAASTAGIASYWPFEQSGPSPLGFVIVMRQLKLEISPATVFSEYCAICLA